MTTENLNNESVVVNKYDNIQYKKSNPFILGKLSNNSISFNL